MRTAKYTLQTIVADHRVREAKKHVRKAQQVLHKAEEELRVAQEHADALHKTFDLVKKADGTSYARAPWGSRWIRAKRQ
jgi:hypothetical protein